MMELTVIEAELLHNVQGGSLADGGYIPNWGETHTILNAAGGLGLTGAFVGSMVPALGSATGAVGGALLGGGTAYMALREQGAAERARAQQPAK